VTLEEAEETGGDVEVDLEAFAAKSGYELRFGPPLLHHPLPGAAQIAMFDGGSRLEAPALCDEHSTAGPQRAPYVPEHVVDVCVRNVLEEKERGDGVVVANGRPLAKDVDAIERDVCRADQSLSCQLEHAL
jgi:hypothetical protein